LFAQRDILFKNYLIKMFSTLSKNIYFCEIITTIYFITLVKFRKKLTQEDFKAFDEVEKEFSKQGLKILNDFYTLGRFDNLTLLKLRRGLKVKVCEHFKSVSRTLN
jgi:hypothetical protein